MRTGHAGGKGQTETPVAENPGRQHLGQLVKANILRDESCTVQLLPWYKETILHLCVILSPNA